MRHSKTRNKDANDVSMDEAGHDASQQEELAGHVE